MVKINYLFIVLALLISNFSVSMETGKRVEKEQQNISSNSLISILKEKTAEAMKAISDIQQADIKEKIKTRLENLVKTVEIELKNLRNEAQKANLGNVIHFEFSEIMSTINELKKIKKEEPYQESSSAQTHTKKEQDEDIERLRQELDFYLSPWKDLLKFGQIDEKQGANAIAQLNETYSELVNIIKSGVYNFDNLKEKLDELNKKLEDEVHHKTPEKPSFATQQQFTTQQAEKQKAINQLDSTLARYRSAWNELVERKKVSKQQAVNALAILEVIATKAKEKINAGTVILEKEMWELFEKNAQLVTEIRSQNISEDIAFLKKQLKVYQQYWKSLDEAAIIKAEQAPTFIETLEKLVKESTNKIIEGKSNFDDELKLITKKQRELELEAEKTATVKPLEKALEITEKPERKPIRMEETFIGESFGAPPKEEGMKPKPAGKQQEWKQEFVTPEKRQKTTRTLDEVLENLKKEVDQELPLYQGEKLDPIQQLMNVWISKFKGDIKQKLDILKNAIVNGTVKIEISLAPLTLINEKNRLVNYQKKHLLITEQTQRLEKLYNNLIPIWYIAIQNKKISKATAQLAIDKLRLLFNEMKTRLFSSKPFDFNRESRKLIDLRNNLIEKAVQAKVITEEQKLMNDIAIVNTWLQLLIFDWQKLSSTEKNKEKNNYAIKLLNDTVSQVKFLLKRGEITLDSALNRLDSLDSYLKRTAITPVRPAEEVKQETKPPEKSAKPEQKREPSPEQKREPSPEPAKPRLSKKEKDEIESQIIRKMSEIRGELNQEKANKKLLEKDSVAIRQQLIRLQNQMLEELYADLPIDIEELTIQKNALLVEANKKAEAFFKEEEARAKREKPEEPEWSQSKPSVAINKTELVKAAATLGITEEQFDKVYDMPPNQARKDEAKKLFNTAYKKLSIRLHPDKDPKYRQLHNDYDRKKIDYDRGRALGKMTAQELKNLEEKLAKLKKDLEAFDAEKNFKKLINDYLILKDKEAFDFD